MRTAHLVGLGPDGRSLIVADDDGEEFLLPADDRLRAALRGDRPRLGQLEIQMDSSLSPRDIQTRIRAGESLEDLARVAGMAVERVERFAAPVLAEREHIASTAMSSSVRRRGETAHHRNLRVAVSERLLSRSVDIDTVDWDAYRREDGRWTVSAEYRVGDEDRHAEFFYNLPGRFSVAGNEEAEWLLGDRPDAADSAEQTVDLSDELALVRATREPPPSAEPLDEPARDEVEPEEVGPRTDPPRVEAAEPTVAVLRRLSAVQVTEVEVEAGVDDAGADDSGADDAGADDAGAEGDAPTGRPAGQSPIDVLYDMLAGDGYSEDSTRVYAGLSDASAVPVVDEHGFDPAGPAGDFPVEPSAEDEDRESEPEPEAVEPEPTPQPVVREDDALIPTPPGGVRKPPAKRKRASVPSWDEIMFGGPKPPS